MRPLPPVVGNDDDWHKGQIVEASRDGVYWLNRILSLEKDDSGRETGRVVLCGIHSEKSKQTIVHKKDLRTALSWNNSVWHTLEDAQPLDMTGVDEPEMNADICLVCGKGGQLLLCDSCPGAYHMGCVGETRWTIPKGDEQWHCPECKVLPLPLRGEGAGDLRWKLNYQPALRAPRLGLKLA